MNRIALALTAGFFSSGIALAAPASKAKVAELAAHRIDRLVQLNKIDKNFVTRLEKIEVTAVNQAPVAFKARVSQTQPAQGQALQLDLSFDQEGKPLAFQPVGGGTAGDDPQWADLDAGSLAEKALHYVLENAGDAKIKKFFDGMTLFTLIKGDLDGQTVARAQVQSSLTTDKLNIYLKLDGTFVSAKIVP